MTTEGGWVKDFADTPVHENDIFPIQTVVDSVFSADERFVEKDPIPLEAQLPPKSKAFFLGLYNYGRPMEIISHDQDKVNIWLLTQVSSIFQSLLT